MNHMIYPDYGQLEEYETKDVYQCYNDDCDCHPADDVKVLIIKSEIDTEIVTVCKWHFDWAKAFIKGCGNTYTIGNIADVKPTKWIYKDETGNEIEA